MEGYVYSEPHCPFSRQQALFNVLTAYSVYNTVSTHPWPAIPQWPCFLSGLLAPVSMPAPTATEVMQGELCSQTDMDGWGADPTFRTEMAHYA